MDREVFVFHGARSRSANAVFSTKAAAEIWIRKHGVSGMLTQHAVDMPGFEEHTKRSQVRVQAGKKPLAPVDPEWYTDGRSHWHYFFGLGCDDEGYEAACDRWNAEHAEA